MSDNKETNRDAFTDAAFPSGRVDPPEYLNPKSSEHKLFLDAVLSATSAAYHGDIQTLVEKMTREMSGYQGNAVVRTADLYAYIGHNPANTRASLEAFISAVCDHVHCAIRSSELGEDRLPRALYFHEKDAPPSAADPYVAVVTRVKTLFSDAAMLKKLIDDDAKARAAGKPPLSLPDEKSLIAWARGNLGLTEETDRALESDLDILPTTIVLDAFYFSEVEEIIEHPSGMVKVMIPHGPIVDTDVRFFFSASNAAIEHLAVSTVFPAIIHFLQNHMSASDRQVLSENIIQELRKGNVARKAYTQSVDQMIEQAVAGGLARSTELELAFLHCMRYAAGQAHSTLLFQLAAFAWLMITRARAVRRSQEDADRQTVMEILLAGAVKRETPPESYYPISYVSLYEAFVVNGNPRYDADAIKAFTPLTKQINGSAIPQYTEIGDGVVLSPRLIDVFDTLLQEMRAAVFNRITRDWAQARIPGLSYFQEHYGNERPTGFLQKSAAADGSGFLRTMLTEIDDRFLAVLNKLIDYRAAYGDVRTFARNIYDQCDVVESGGNPPGTDDAQRLTQLKTLMLTADRRVIKKTYDDGLIRREVARDGVLTFTSFHEKVEAMFDTVVYRSMNARVIAGRETRPLVEILQIGDYRELRDAARRIRRQRGGFTIWERILQFFRSFMSGISSAGKDLQIKTRLYAATDKAERERILKDYRGPNRAEMESIVAQWDEHERARKQAAPQTAAPRAAAPVNPIKIKHADAYSKTRDFLSDTAEKKDLVSYLLKKYYVDRAEYKSNTSIKQLIDATLVSETNNILYLSVAAVKALKEGRQKDVLEYLSARHETLMNFLTQRGISVGEPDLVKRLRPLEPLFRKDMAAERSLARVK